VEVGRLCLQKSHYLADRLSQLSGWRLPFKNSFFKEFCVEPPLQPEKVVDELEKRSILAGIPLGRLKKEWQKYLLVAVTERRKREEMDEFVEAMGQIR
jgi:glycine dehydrogenase subunit 1